MLVARSTGLQHRPAADGRPPDCSCLNRPCTLTPPSWQVQGLGGKGRQAGTGRGRDCMGPGARSSAWGSFAAGAEAAQTASREHPRCLALQLHRGLHDATECEGRDGSSGAWASLQLCAVDCTGSAGEAA